MSEKIKKKKYWLKENTKYQVILFKVFFSNQCGEIIYLAKKGNLWHVATTVEIYDVT